MKSHETVSAPIVRARVFGPNISNTKVYPAASATSPFFSEYDKHIHPSPLNPSGYGTNWPVPPLGPPQTYRRYLYFIFVSTTGLPNALIRIPTGLCKKPQTRGVIVPPARILVHIFLFCFPPITPFHWFSQKTTIKRKYTRTYTERGLWQTTVITISPLIQSDRCYILIRSTTLSLSSLLKNTYWFYIVTLFYYCLLPPAVRFNHRNTSRETTIDLMHLIVQGAAVA